MVFSIKRTVQFDDEGNKLLSDLRNRIDEMRQAVLDMLENSNRHSPMEIRARIESINRNFTACRETVDSLKKMGDDLPE